MAAQPKPQAPWGEYVQRVGPMTVEQFEQFPTEDGWTYELHHRRLIAMPGPGIEHADIQTRLTVLLSHYLDAHSLGIITGTSCSVLPIPGSREDVLCPDLSYVLPERKAAMPQRGSYLAGAPDLVIEIASPNDTRPELAAKTAIYLQAGVRLMWIVWPKTQAIDVWLPSTTNQPSATLAADDTLDGRDVIPGFQCAVREIFAQ
jgi:Uma2 family endonuclease